MVMRGKATGLNTLAGAAQLPGGLKPQPKSAAPKPAGQPLFSMLSPTQAQALSPGASTAPLDPAYQQTIAALTTRRDTSLAGLAGQRGNTLTDYGYNATFNPDGTVGSLSFDPNNPYSRAALLQQSFQRAQRGTQNSYAAAGQGFSGALRNAQNTNDQGYSQGNDALQKALIRQLAAITSGEGGARSDFETAAAQAGLQAAGRSVSQAGASAGGAATLTSSASSAPAVASPSVPANVSAANPGPVSKGGSGLGAGVSLVNGKLLYKGQPLTQKQWDMLNRGLSPYTGHPLK